MTNEQVRKDGDRIDNIMRRYTGAGGAHFGFICDGTEGGKCQHFAGGNMALIGMMISDGLVKLIRSTPGLTDQMGKAFVEEIAYMVGDMLDNPANAEPEGGMQ